MNLRTFSVLFSVLMGMASVMAQYTPKLYVSKRATPSSPPVLYDYDSAKAPIYDSLSSATLQRAYNKSTAPQITTNGTRGALVLQRGSANDTDSVLAIRNGAGSTIARIRGDGRIEGASAKMSSLVGSGYRALYANDTGLVSDTTPAGMRGIIGVFGTKWVRSDTSAFFTSSGDPVQILNIADTARYIPSAWIKTGTVIKFKAFGEISFGSLSGANLFGSLVVDSSASPAAYSTFNLFEKAQFPSGFTGSGVLTYSVDAEIIFVNNAANTRSTPHIRATTKFKTSTSAAGIPSFAELQYSSTSTARNFTNGLYIGLMMDPDLVTCFFYPKFSFLEIYVP